MIRRGWCPSLYEPMQTGDGLLVRVSPPAARLTSAAARALADAAELHGNGTIELTRRGNLQVRGLAFAGVGPFAEAMVAAGLADPDPAIERRRIVIPAPLAGDDPAVPSDDFPARIEAMIPNGLPAKFCIAIDAGGTLAGTPAADLVIKPDNGPFPLSPRERVGVRATAQHTLKTIRQQLDQAVRQPRTPIAAHPPQQTIGFLPYNDGHGAFGVGLPFGQTDASGLRMLARLADRFSGGAIRTSPWRAFLLGRVAESDLPALKTVLAASPHPSPLLEGEGAAFVTDPADPRLRVTACIGSPGCASATVAARVDAARAAASGTQGPLHFSGCTKGCAYPGGPAMVGQDGRYVRTEAWRPGTPP